MQRWLRGFLRFGRKQPTGRLLMTLNEAIADGFSYVRRIAPGTQTPRETLRSRKGSCRDFALLMMEAARSLGFAARFVTGISMFPTAMAPGGSGAGRPMPGVKSMCLAPGRSNLIPTNGIVGNRDLVRVAVARTPDQAIPLSGVYYGDRCDELGMEVEVNVKSEDPLGNTPEVASIPMGNKWLCGTKIAVKALKADKSIQFA